MFQIRQFIFHNIKYYFRINVEITMNDYVAHSPRWAEAEQRQVRRRLHRRRSITIGCAYKNYENEKQEMWIYANKVICKK